VLIIAGVIVCLVLAGTYSAVTSLSIQDTQIEQTPEGSLIQILSPQNNTTYRYTRNLLLNITASDAVAKITYFLTVDDEYYELVNCAEGPKIGLADIIYLKGDSNVTYTEPIEFSDLRCGVHVLYVYAFDVNGDVVECQTVTFINSSEVPTVYLTQQEYQEILYYFESEGLTIVPPPERVYFLFKDVFYFWSAEEFVSAVKANGISTISKWDNSPKIAFQGVLDGGWLPTYFDLNVIII